MVEQAKALREEYKNQWYFYSPARKAGLVRRVKNLASKINRNCAADTPEAIAMMYLDHIALWLDLDLNYGGH